MCECRYTLGHILPAEGISATEQPLLSSEGSHRDPMWCSTHIPFTGWCITPGASSACFPGGVPPIRQESSPSQPRVLWIHMLWPMTDFPGRCVAKAAPTAPRQDCQTAHASELPAGNRLKGVCCWASFPVDFSHCPILSFLSYQHPGK